MSSKYDAPGARAAAAPRQAERALDSATMWESLNGGADPTEYEDEEPAGETVADHHTA
jgi:hypothetical protein